MAIHARALQICQRTLCGGGKSSRGRKEGCIEDWMDSMSVGGLTLIFIMFTYCTVSACVCSTLKHGKRSCVRVWCCRHCISAVGELVYHPGCSLHQSALAAPSLHCSGTQCLSFCTSRASWYRSCTTGVVLQDGTHRRCARPCKMPASRGPG